jgi:predicted MPP superfamily phosphohydrolase
MDENKIELVEPLKKRRTENKVLIRREILRKLLMEGHPTQMQLANALKVSRKTIEIDMRAVEEEKLSLLSKENAIAILIDYLWQNKGAYEQAWELFKKAKHPNIKIGALRLIHDFHQDKIKVMQSLGMLKAVSPEERKSIEISFVKPDWIKKDENNGNDKSGKNKDNTELLSVESAGEVPQ